MQGGRVLVLRLLASRRAFHPPPHGQLAPLPKKPCSPMQWGMHAACTQYLRWRFANSFLKTLHQSLKLSNSAEFLSVVKRRARELETEHKSYAIDSHSSAHLHIATVIVASHQVLSPELQNDRQLFERMKTSLLSHGNLASRLLAESTRRVVGSPIKPLNRRVHDVAASVAGASFDCYAKTSLALHEVTIVVERCFFHSFLSSIGYAFLLPLFCAWDLQLAMAGHGRVYTVERPTTLHSHNSKACVFHLKCSAKQKSWRRLLSRLRPSQEAVAPVMTAVSNNSQGRHWHCVFPAAIFVRVSVHTPLKTQRLPTNKAGSQTLYSIR